uniref:(California timema) hypothetical protein n=1 Tax=Timema californicum TaxID=61474 RepID=A0A7R9J0A1_TIMCA|nr:unnamed protein product [Timema californicum]
MAGRMGKGRQGEILRLSDGGEVGLDWLEDNCSSDAPVIIILPGLTGASQAEYVKCLTLAANQIGIRIVVFNNRGLGGLILKSRTIREFDATFTVKQFGFKDIDDYYTQATMHEKLHLIKIPLLCLNAADDPFQPFDAVPLEAARISKFVAIMMTARGGHIGFLEGIWPLVRDQYISRVFAQYFGAVFRNEADILHITEQYN